MVTITEYLDGIAEGDACFVDAAGDDIVACEVPFAKLRDLFANRVMVTAVGLLGRPGVAYFSRYLELVYFPPRTASNKLLMCFFWKWQGVGWSIVSIPRLLRDGRGNDVPGESLIREAAERAGLRASEGAFPAVTDGYSKLDSATMPATDPMLFAAGFVQPDMAMEHAIYLENSPDISSIETWMQQYAKRKKWSANLKRNG